MRMVLLVTQRELDISGAMLVNYQDARAGRALIYGGDTHSLQSPRQILQ
jgi:hypothetical protein